MSPSDRLLGVLIVAVTATLGTVEVSAQQQLQFVISASDASGRPVTDLARSDIIFTEDGVPNEIVKVQPFGLPVELTLAVDNSSTESLVHLRSGLEGLVRRLDSDIEIELITIAPQPRRVVRATTDRVEILRGIRLFGPETPPHFTDALVEFSQRYQGEFNETNTFDSIPVLVMLSTTAPEQWSYEAPEVSRALKFLRARRARVYVTMLSERNGAVAAAQLNDNRQALIGIPAVESTGGKYEPLAISNRLVSLLPEWGDEINALHRKYGSQVLVTAVRREGLTGPLRNPEIRLAFPGLNGEVSVNGVPPMVEPGR